MVIFVKGIFGNVNLEIGLDGSEKNKKLLSSIRGLSMKNIILAVSFSCLFSMSSYLIGQKKNSEQSSRLEI